MSYFNQDEQVIWEGAPQVTNTKNSGCLNWFLNFFLTWVIGALAIGAFISFIIHSIIWGVILLLAAGAIFYINRKTKMSRRRLDMKLYYVLTNQRAIVLRNIKKKEPDLIEEGELMELIPVSQNKINYSHSDMQTRASSGKTIGDVAFFEGPILRVKFLSIIDPDGIIQTVEQIKKSMYQT